MWRILLVVLFAVYLGETEGFRFWGRGGKRRSRNRGTVTRRDMLGCYEDSRNRVLNGRRTYGNHMTVGRCRRRCEKERKRFYGVEAGNECFCGNSMRYKKRKPLKECRMKCKGNHEACGGAWRILIYRNPKYRNSNNRKGKIRRKDMLGCYKDSRKRVLSGRRTHGNHMTVGRCRRRCEKERKRYYGLEAGNECFCGNSMRYKKRKPLKECRMKCKGNHEACGGAWRILIYRNPKYRNSDKRKGKIRRKDMLGCYKDSRKRVLSGRRTHGNHMTVGRCRRRCEKERKRYYGLEAGNECFCGNSMRYKKRKPLKECRMKCKGNHEACGGAWRILIYRNPKYRNSDKRKGKIRRKDMLGCYRDSRKRVLSGRRTHGNHMTVGRCRRRCEKERKRFYGLEAGNECFCGNSMRFKKRKPLKECRMKCKGNHEACGGVWRILIYRNPKYRNSDKRKGKIRRKNILGCFKDSRKRVLSGRRTHGNHMTVGRCRRRCEKERKRFYGLEAGNECFCGNSMRYKKRKPLKECRMKCKGNHEACGGVWRILIYRNPKYRNSDKRKGKIRRKDMLGCYKDSRKRVLSGRRTHGNHMTVGRCRRRCEKERKRFYGLEAGNECFCGNSMRYKERKPLKECRMKCKGNHEACGGAWRILIYKNPKYRNSDKRKGKIRRKNMLGCYKDSRKRVLSGRRTHGNYMTVGRCRRRCEKERKRFYGLEAGNECFCGNSMRYKKRKPLKECRMKCKGNHEACGGAWRILIYRNPKYRNSDKRKGKIRRKNMLGCYKDSRKRVLSGRRTYGNHMTVGRCRRRCEKERKRFYGLEAGNECFCGNSMRYKKRKPLKECRMKCKGNHEACGGAWRILIYRNPKYRSSGFIGCYKDGWYRTLGGSYRRSRYMTINKCLNICKRKRNRYAGVENGVECFCGNSLRRRKKVANSQCKMPCRGNRKQGCGGRWRIAIYKTNVKKGNNCGRHRKCHSNARCVNGECRCNKGYTGDGVKRCYQTCTCSASGDPHYRTFDGQMIHFMGICKYTLTKVKNSRSNIFNVEVKNEYRGRSRSVSYTRLVDVKLGKNTIRLHKKHQVYLNGLRIFLPYTRRGEFRIFRSGNKVKVIASTNDGDGVVTWDGSSSVIVTVPKNLGRRMTGLCGDCNGKKDDFRTKYGKDVSRDPKKFIKIGNSYTVKDDTDQIHQSCEAQEAPNKCTPELRKKAMDSKVCGFLNPEKKDQSPFRDCLAESPTTSKEMFENCVFDFCTYYSEVSQKKRTICQSVNGYAEYCADLGISAKWRSSDFCPLPCGENMVYDSEMSGCPATCVDPDSEEDCDQPPTEGCRCKEGFVLSDNKCVEKSKCGCKGADSKYYPLETTFTSSDCTTVQQCKVEGGSVGFKIILTKPKCGQHQTCSVLNGSPTCVCQKGYISNGRDGCLEESPTCNSKKTDLKCESSSGNKVVCTVPKAKAVLHVRSTASDCKYGSTYGISGDGIWVSLACKGTFSVCYIPVPPPPELECLAHDDPLGKKYQGTVSSTELGYTCQKWSSQSPHAHSLLTTLDNNHCRNPDNERAAWCYTTDPKKRWDYCHIPVCPGARPTINVDECLNAGDPKGLKYSGYKNTTKSGKTCQDWGRQRPHSHSFKKLADQSNFCRNPDNEAAPWCYTTSSATRWEFCSIPDCGECDIKQERSLQCEIVYKVTGKCYFASSALGNCKFTVRLNEYRSGESEARILKDGKAHILRAGDTHKSCASFEMRSNTLYVVEKLCKEKCTKSPVIVN